jgi:hypothetical protein
LIGFYIVEYEQNGKDKAAYGKALLKSIASDLEAIKGLYERSLRRYRQFYLSYSYMAESIRETADPVFEQKPIRGSLLPF